MLSGTDYSQPGPYTVGTLNLNVARTAGGSGTFGAIIFYPATSAAEGAPLNTSGGAYPVVSFAHGYITDPVAEYSLSMSHLASYGYVVIAPKSYTSILDAFNAVPLGNDQASAYNYLVGQNAAPASLFYQHVDTSGFAAMGHSMGGAASISEASRNANVKTVVTWAAANIAIQNDTAGQLANVHVPVQLLAGTQDSFISNSSTADLYNRGNAPLILNNMIGGYHFGFEDYGTGFGADSGSMPRATELAYARSFSVAWLNLYMKGDQSAWRKLWGPEAAADPQILNSLKPGIAVTTPTMQQSGNDGSVIDYSITVQNTGTYATSYSLLAEGNVWNASFSALHTPVIGPGGSATVHAFVTVPAGTPTGTIDSVLVSARNDTDGGTRAYTQLQSTAIRTSAVQLAPNAQNSNLTDLVWTGTSGDDQAKFERIDDTTIRVIALKENGLTVNYIREVSGVTGRVRAAAGTGNDTLDASGLTTTQATLDGGAGNNTLYGGQAGDILIGGSNGGEGAQGSNTIIAGNGNNTIYGNAQHGYENSTGGNNLIVGGTGNDTIYGAYDVVTKLSGAASNGAEGGRNLIVGGGGADTIYASRTADGAEGAKGSILVSGTTTLDPTALAAVLSEWTSARDYATRIANISGTGTGARNNGSSFLQAGVTVANDHSPDLLFGDSNGQFNWLIETLADDFASRSKPGETITDLP
ncbi:MAG: dienelactone hydrolase family protein [Pirellulales bacterium]|nr:dienelactone hydrolase family protein [Pirellulales bacterium]